MFRIIFIRDRFLCYDVIGERGFVFLPDKKGKESFRFCGYRVWNSSLNIFIVCQRNVFLTLEALFHEIGHLILYQMFRWLGEERVKKVNQWYDLAYGLAWGVTWKE